MVYIYFYETIFQKKSIYMVFKTKKYIKCDAIQMFIIINFFSQFSESHDPASPLVLPLRPSCLLVFFDIYNQDFF
jgi:hypothetical protein